MSRKPKTRRPAPSTDPTPTGSGRDAAPSRRWPSPWLALGLIVLLLGAGLYFASTDPHWPTDPPTPPDAMQVAAKAAAPLPVPAYVGGAACTACHASELAAWQGSQHDRAMTVASDSTVLGRFERTTFRHQGVTSTFFRRDGKFFVNTDGLDGKLADFEIKYTFGVAPLQQYLVEFGGGRLQALGIAWDTRPEAQGGRRWFHLYPDRKLAPGSPLHWTGIDQTWNYQCADCHSTNLRKNYDEENNRYATTWTDINVNCEACHGPGSNHLAWAKREGDWRRLGGAGKGLTGALDERHGVTWAIDASTGNAVRSTPRESSREIETCARCHARRGQFSDRWHAGERFGDGFRTSLIEPGLYYADGQMRDEVYNYGSFLSSRMQAHGVTCSDCHDPHTQKIRAPGNAVCGQCHAPGKYDAQSHHHHAAGTPGAACASCHMPTTTYMVVDPRHDHSFRIPRPDRTLSLGVPNACNACHADRQPQWAVGALKTWYPQPKPGFQTFAETFAAAQRGDAGAAAALAGIAQDRAQSGFAQASAVRRLGRDPGPAGLPALRSALGDPDALVRAAAADALSSADAGLRVQLLAPLLGDPVREVRMEAARALAGVGTQLPAAIQPVLTQALAEYEDAERFNADRPEGRANLGNLYATQGRFDEAEAAYRSAIALDPSFVQARLNLADLQRSRGAEGDAEKTLREALARDPRSAPVWHALGLSLVRQRRNDEALKALGQAAALVPDEPRFAYVYAVALNDAGQRARAVRELEAALKRQPDNRDLLLALVMFERDAGHRREALDHARRLAALDPANPGLQQLIAELSGLAR